MAGNGDVVSAKRGEIVDLVWSWAERERWAWPGDLNRFICRSRRRVGWCEFSALLFKPLCCRCSTPGMISFFAAPYLASLSVIMVRGGRICSSAASGATAWRLPVASALDEDVEHYSVLVHRTPQPMLHASDLQHDLVPVPFVARAR